MGTTAHSDDLRSRVVAEILAGASRRQAAERFKVSAASAVRWAQLYSQTGGVGLGLAIAHRAIGAHHGNISAENAAPGLRVRMEIPK